MSESFKNFEMAKCVLMDRMPYFYHWTGLMTYGEVANNANIPFMAAVPDTKAGTFRLWVNPAMVRVVPTKGVMMGIAKCVMEVIHGTYKEEKLLSHPLGMIASDLEKVERLLGDGFKMAEHPEFPGESLFVTVELIIQYAKDIWALVGEPDREIPEPKRKAIAEYYLNWLTANLPTPQQLEEKRKQEEQKLQDAYDKLTDEEKEELEKFIEQLREAAEKMGLLQQRAAHPEIHLPPEKQAIFDYLAAKQAQTAYTQSGGVGMGSMGGDVKRLIESLKSRVNWRTHTRKFRGQAGHVKLTYTFTRANKYGGTPGNKYEQGAEALFVVDDSGSMGQRAVAQGVGEAEESGKHVSTTLIFVDDHEDIKEENVYRNFKKRTNRQVSATGGGGTDMRRVFDYIKRGQIKRPDVVIIFTDGYTPFPTKAQRMGIRTLWVCTNAHIKIPREAGEVIYMPPEDSNSDTASAY